MENGHEIVAAIALLQLGFLGFALTAFMEYHAKTATPDKSHTTTICFNVKRSSIYSIKA